MSETNAKKKVSVGKIILGLIMIVVSILCFTMPGHGALLCWAIMIGLLLKGVMEIFVYAKTHKENPGSGLVLGDAIVSLLFGIILLSIYCVQPAHVFIPELGESIAINTGKLNVLVIIGYFIGFSLLFGGINRIIGSFALKKAAPKGWGWMLFMGILLTITGMVALGAPLLTLDFSLTFVGVLLLIFGIQSIVFGFVGRD